jgi:hypothetical protein
MSLGDKAVLFLIGAGCSYEAGIPMSSTMIERIESKISDKSSGWSDYRELYFYVKHTIEYGTKLGGILQDFNIESLLVTLHHLSEHRKSILYPFISGYSNDLVEYAGRNFRKISDLIKRIEDELPKWITKSDYKPADYYAGFASFQKEYNYPVRVFTLNYDLCVEKLIDNNKLETGFSDGDPWDGTRFTHTSDDELEAPIYLYKLHGSIDWERTKTGLIRSQQQGITPEIVFGTDVKMQAVDPYLFYLYEFRKYALLSKIIVIIGYSFSDTHINDLIKQALEADNTRKLLVISPYVPENVSERVGLGASDECTIIERIGAKEFLSSKLSVEQISSYLPAEDIPF